MINVTLYKDAIPDNNRNSISGCANIEQQKQYFNNLDKIIINQERMTWNEPFIVYHNQGDLWEYQYGSFDYKDRTYYFSIDQIEPINDNKSEIDYRIDWLETLKYEITFNDSFIFSTNKDLLDRYTKNYYEQPPDYYTYEPIQLFNLSFKKEQDNTSYAIVFIQHCSKEDTHPEWANKDVLCFAIPKNPDGTDIYYNICNTILIEEDINRGLTEQNKIINKASDIYGLWIIPEEFTLSKDYFTRKEGTYQNYYYVDLTYVQPVNEQQNVNIVTLNQYVYDQIKSTKPNNQLVFLDEMGGTVWEQPFNQNFSIPSIKRMYITYNINYSQFTIKVTIDTDNSTDSYRTPSQYTFTYIPISLDTTTDAYQDYVYLQRQQDIDLRNLNMNKNLVKGLGSAQQSAMFGGLMGNQFGRDLGMKKGQAIGGIGDLVSTLTDYQTEQYFAPMEQKIIDKQYMRQDDSITQGSQGQGFQGWGFKSGFYYRKYDEKQNNCFNRQFRYYGYKYNQIVQQTEMQEVFNKTITENEFSHLKQDVTLLKNYNDEIRKQIHQRLYNGISFNAPISNLGGSNE